MGIPVEGCWWGVVAGHTYTEQCQAFETLAGNYGHELHLAYEGYFGGRQPWRKWQRHCESVIVQCWVRGGTR